jgi:uncharacterized protein YndB with AHSA1/START domain
MSATTATSTVKVLSDRELSMTRDFDAPREVVFKAHTDPSLIPQWWGQRTSVTIVDEMDVRPGGRWRFVARDTEGNEYAFRGEYCEIVPSERLVNTFEWEGMPGHITEETTTFEALPNGQTRLTVTSRFASIEDRDGMLGSGMESGGNETWDRLAELLANAGAI